MSALQPDAATAIDRTTVAPFLLRLYWRVDKLFDPWEFSVVSIPHLTTMHSARLDVFTANF